MLGSPFLAYHQKPKALLGWIMTEYAGLPDNGGQLKKLNPCLHLPIIQYLPVARSIIAIDSYASNILFE